jgi:hypothetical protein
VSIRDDLHRQVEEALDDLPCKCGHERVKHVNLRARCATDCGCVRYEPKALKSILNRALSLDDQLELANRELRRLRALTAALLDEVPADVQAIVRDNERFRGALLDIVKDPTSTREAVQSIAIRTLRL